MKRNLCLRLAGLVSVLFLLVGCGTATVDSDKVDESEYYREMVVHYDASAKTTVAEFQFSIGGFQYGTQRATTLHLVAPSQALIENKPAKFFDSRNETDLLGIGSYYHLELGDTALAPSQNDIHFTWVKKDSSEETETVARPKAITVLGGETNKINRNQPFRLGLRGDALQGGEFIMVTIFVYDPAVPTGSTPIPESVTIHRTLNKMEDAVFTAQDMRALITGQARISVERVNAWRHNRILKESRFSAIPLEVEITD